ncbi:MAG: hypothetical protein KatS3mg111_0513 [Pirellulaceae bacterium]|nr:MAG: hypothetical protein KatS3mg111_0513 [Pirellulaceae bacterium]
MPSIQGPQPTLDLSLLQRLQTRPSVGEQPAAGEFAELLTEGVLSVNSMQQDADAKIHDLLTGGEVSQVEVITAVQKADMAFRMLVQVRNKLLAAYEEINGIRV